MEEEAQLIHLPRCEKKRLVKGWHATQVPTDSSSPVPSEGVNGITCVGSMRSLFATPLGAMEYESQRTSTWRSAPDLFNDPLGNHNQQHEEKLPKTVGQVKHAYRARARKQEARDTSNAIRQREKFLGMRRGPKWQDQLSKSKKQSPQLKAPECQQESIVDEEIHDNELADSPQNEFGGELQLLNLSADEVVTNAAYRDDILRQIRRHLVNGGEVLLQSDCTVSKETVSSTRLMLQTLCTQSLAYCVRDQNIVPDTLPQPYSTIRLTLRLLPRHTAI